MLYVALVQVEFTEYMGGTTYFDEIFPIEADNQIEARDMLDTHFNNKSSSYGDHYRCDIKSINQLLTKDSL